MRLLATLILPLLVSACGMRGPLVLPPGPPPPPLLGNPTPVAPAKVAPATAKPVQGAEDVNTAKDKPQ